MNSATTISTEAVPRGTNRLTDKQIQSAALREAPYKLSDGSGLYLLVNPTGAKWWRLKYRIAGREKLISIGVYPDVPLKLARSRRDDARRMIADGIDPSMRRKSERAAHANTFKALAEEWLEQQSKTLSAVTIRAKRSRLETWTYRTIGNMPITSIEPPLLLEMLQRIEKTDRRETAHRVRQAVKGVFQHAILTHRAQRNPTADLHGALLPVVVEHHAAITDPVEVGALLRAIDGYRGSSPITEIALRLTPLLFVRPGELRAAEWQELRLTGKTPEWRIPAKRIEDAAPAYRPSCPSGRGALRGGGEAHERRPVRLPHLTRSYAPNV